MLTTLQKLIHSGIQRLSPPQNDSSWNGNSSFHAYVCTPNQPLQQSCHKALELDEVLIQVWSYETL